jgi:acetyl-CoA carboxylase biotin carboxylase subunit
MALPGKVLIANRGEIACRVMRTCARLGIVTVAIHSDADDRALHVMEADEAVSVGPPPLATSYLNIEAIIRAARELGADAIHPGYGLLSENAAFARACESAGITFIGPLADHLEALGDKVKTRELFQSLGLPVVPGTEVTVGEDALEVAETVGYPVLVKAAHGGGGIGMAVAGNRDELTKRLPRSMQLAGRAFGKDAVYLERYLPGARHVEAQIAGDGHGNAVHFFERECSVQRRYQKVIEEAPCTSLPDSVRQALADAAAHFAASIGYRGVGTIESLVDRDENFYFLEVNPRLQVEHPVTEEVLGIDLVELQLRIAAGEDLERPGHADPQGVAIEARVYAEDPVTHFPSPGEIHAFDVPAGEGVRVDFGYRAGDEVSQYFDPLLAKVIAHGPNRGVAIERMANALASFRVEGVKTNIPLLSRIMASSEYHAGAVHTGWLEPFVKETAAAAG